LRIADTREHVAERIVDRHRESVLLTSST
jgi:hypothetical protein